MDRGLSARKEPKRLCGVELHVGVRVLTLRVSYENRTTDRPLWRWLAPMTARTAHSETYEENHASCSSVRACRRKSWREVGIRERREDDEAVANEITAAKLK